MGFFRTKDPKTGEPRLGAGVYILLCLAMVGGVVLWNVRQNANDPVIGRAVVRSKLPVNPTNIAPVAAAAEEHKASVNGEVPGVASSSGSARDYTYGEQPGNDTTSPTAQAEEPDNLDTIQNTVELIRENRERAEREKAEAVARAEAEANAKIAELKRKALVTTTAENAPISSGRPATPVRADNQEAVDVNASALVVFDAKRDRKPAPNTNAPLVKTGFETNNFLPRGQFFPVYILTTIQTVNQEDMVVMSVAENVIFQHKVQLPFGTRILGTAGATNFEDRVAVNVDTILFPDGRELPISGFLKDSSDLASGVKGYYIPQPLRIQLTPYINEFIAAWTEASVSRYSDSLENNDGIVALAGAQEASNLIRDQANRIQQRLDRRYPEKVVVPIGTKAYVQLRSPLDLTRARIAGSLGNTQPVLPGFENNPISPSGNVERTAAQPTGQLTSTTPQPPAPGAALPPANNNATQQQANNYLDALNQLDSMQRQLQANKNPRTAPANTNNNTRINWPSGDIE